MTGTLVAVVLAGLTMFVVSELVVAVLPMIIVIAFIPPVERPGVATVLAAAGGSRRLRLWRALRLAVKARRLTRGNAGPLDRSPCCCAPAVRPGCPFAAPARTAPPNPHRHW
ncbi:hypothetical protein [Actinoplanes awajinensis]|uniref:hypothetical protein n=1 Tax=Actinoplanes awajinensis TaxID=135946 RepID=UPI000AA52771|nr:hypothetical protein [Actinoplanes awajinensis]